MVNVSSWVEGTRFSKWGRGSRSRVISTGPFSCEQTFHQDGSESFEFFMDNRRVEVFSREEVECARKVLDYVDHEESYAPVPGSEPDNDRYPERIDELAYRFMIGAYGNGAWRKVKALLRGYSFDEISEAQRIVNERKWDELRDRHQFRAVSK